MVRISFKIADIANAFGIFYWMGSNNLDVSMRASCLEKRCMVIGQVPNTISQIDISCVFIYSRLIRSPLYLYTNKISRHGLWSFEMW